MQPPGYNLAVGLTVKLLPNHYVAVLWGTQIVFGAPVRPCDPGGQASWIRKFLLLNQNTVISATARAVNVGPT